MTTPKSTHHSNEHLSVNTDAIAVVQKVHKVEEAYKQPHVHRRDLPDPSTQRLQASLKECAFDLDKSNSEGLPCEIGADTDTPETVLYLAYGSNLCRETFQGRRGIRPLSAINVVVPELALTFDLPGIPYTEPCFANTKYRKPASSPPPSTATSEKSPLLQPNVTRALPSESQYPAPHWDKGLVGVVYEVTLQDYAHIIATEGGGASYQDILIACYPLPHGTTHIPTQPSTPTFNAHTLYSPVYPPGKAPPGSSGRLSRPDPNYAQPSARYLKLITDGANENAIPAEYASYLLSLQPYTITSTRQRVGGKIFRTTWLPIITAIFRLSARFADKRGRVPGWLTTITGWIFQGVWLSYDTLFYRAFGDGERTQQVEEVFVEEEKKGGGV